MTELLIRLFIKDKGNLQNAKVRESYGFLAAMVGILSNILLAVGKVTIGALINSLAVLADGLNNFSDTVSSIVSLISFKVSTKPADKGHPFGHGRIEYVAAMIVSFLVLLVGYEILKQGIQKILHPEALTFDPLMTGILVVSALIKVWQMGVNRKIGKLIGSDTLVATGLDSRNDVLVTSGTILAIFITHFTGFNVDGYIALGIGLFILYSGYGMAKEMINTLMGQSIKKEDADRIKEAIMAYDGILGLHDLISHTYGPTYSMVSIHAEVSDKVPIDISHDLIERIEREAGDKLGIHLVIHMDPVTLGDERLNGLKGIVQQLLEKYPTNLSAHDFRLVDGEEQTNFIFDLELPFNFQESDKESLERELTEAIKAKDGECNVVINMEYSFIED